MPVSPDFRDFVLEQLQRFDRAVSARAMFGGYGLYSQAVLCGVLDDDVVYLRTDEAGRARFVARGSRPFAPMGGEKPMLGYWEVPADVLEDRDELAAWAREARGVALAARAAKEAKAAKRTRAVDSKPPRKRAASEPSKPRGKR
jgi:DNA transformation protein